MKSTGTSIAVIVMVYSVGSDSVLERAAMVADWVPFGRHCGAISKNIMVIRLYNKVCE
jgi:hypothetical protein